MISSAQTALALLTGQSRTVPAAPTADAKAAEAKRPPSATAASRRRDSRANPFGSTGAFGLCSAGQQISIATKTARFRPMNLAAPPKTTAPPSFFAAIESDGDGQMSVDDLDRFLKSVGEAIGASNGGPPADAPPPQKPLAADQPSAHSAVSSLLEGLITAQANDGSVNNGKSTRRDDRAIHQAFGTNRVTVPRL